MTLLIGMEDHRSAMEPLIRSRFAVAVLRVEKAEQPGCLAPRPGPRLGRDWAMKSVATLQERSFITG